MSDAISLIAGILLTSAGLVALLPYVLKRGRRYHCGNLAVDGGYASVADAVAASAAEPAGAQRSVVVPESDLEELKAYLFNLRMTVGDVMAELQDTRQALASEDSIEVGADFIDGSEAPDSSRELV